MRPASKVDIHQFLKFSNFEQVPWSIVHTTTCQMLVRSLKPQITQIKELLHSTLAIVIIYSITSNAEYIFVLSSSLTD